MLRLVIVIFAFSVVLAEAEQLRISGCTIQKREGANFDGAYTSLAANTEEECVQKCIDEYPQCSAVDFNLQNHACAAHGAQTGVGHWQSNSCCNRYEIISCDGTAAAAECRTPVDQLVFLVDGSSSILPSDWTDLQQFLVNASRMFDVGAGRTRVGIIQYSTNAEIVYRLTDFQSQSHVASAIYRMQHEGGSANLAEAMDLALNQLFIVIDPRSPQRWPRAAKVLVIVTDGRSDDLTQTMLQSWYMKRFNIKIVGVGIVQRGDEGHQELRQIASDPQDVDRLRADTFDDLHLKLHPLLAAACRPPVLSGCTIQKREGANFDGAYTSLAANTEEECLQKCIDNYPQCVAVDFNLQSRVCAAHHAQTGVHWQSNSCCNRYEITCYTPYARSAETGKDSKKAWKDWNGDDWNWAAARSAETGKESKKAWKDWNGDDWNWAAARAETGKDAEKRWGAWGSDGCDSKRGLCGCGRGYKRHPKTGCMDIDECATYNGGCSVDADCTNTPGSYTCTCKPGYTGDGVSCTVARAETGKDAEKRWGDWEYWHQW